MTTKDNIEKLRKALEISIGETDAEGLTKHEIIQLSQRLDKEISRFYSESSIDYEKKRK